MELESSKRSATLAYCAVALQANFCLKAGSCILPPTASITEQTSRAALYRAHCIMSNLTQDMNSKAETGNGTLRGSNWSAVCWSRCGEDDWDWKNDQGREKSKWLFLWGVNIPYLSEQLLDLLLPSLPYLPYHSPNLEKPSPIRKKQWS